MNQRISASLWAVALASAVLAGPAFAQAKQNGTAKQTSAAKPASTPAPTVASVGLPPSQAQEQAATRRLNDAQASFASEQMADNVAQSVAAETAYEEAQRERRATIARQQREHAAQVAAIEAEAERVRQEYEASMARWRADVAACQGGDLSRCAAPK